MKKTIWLGVAVIVLAVSTFLIRPWWMGSAPTYETVKVSRDTLRQTVLATGVVQPQNRLEIKPPIAARAESILVKEGQTVRKGQLLAFLSSTERAAVLDAARSRGKEELERWKQMYKATPLVAPINGLIIARRVEPGQTITTQEAVLVMSDRLIVRAQVDETDIGRIQVGQKAKITLDAYPQERIFGSVDHVAFEAKTVNNVTTYEVEVVPREVPDVMRSGMTANVNFVVAVKEDALIIPSHAIKNEDRKNFVLMAPGPNDRSPARKEVEIGLSDGKNVEILSGLAEGDSVLMVKPDFKSRGERKANPFSPFGGQNRSRRKGER